MRRMVDKLLYQYGSELVLTCQGKECTARGFFRAVNSRDRQSMEKTASPLGTADQGKYTYIGPADLPVAEGDAIAIGGSCYEFRRVEPFYYGDEILYYWGLCVKKGADEPWASQS